MIYLMGGLTTHSTRADGAWMSFNCLEASPNASRRVNSGVRHASHKQDSSDLSNEARKTNAELNGRITGRSNISFDASGMSLAVIVSLNQIVVNSRRVNSGVRPQSDLTG